MAVALANRENGRRSVRENPIRALAKAVFLLEQLADEREATPRRLAELLDEPRTTVYRLLRSLEALDLVEPGTRRPGTYRLGWKLMRLGARRRRAARRAAGGAAGDGADPRGDRGDGLPARAPRRRGGLHRAASKACASSRSRCASAARSRCTPARARGAARLGAASPNGRPTRATARSKPLHGPRPRPCGQAAASPSSTETREQGYAVSDEDVTPGIGSLGAPIFDYTGGDPRRALDRRHCSQLAARRRCARSSIDLLVDGARDISTVARARGRLSGSAHLGDATQRRSAAARSIASHTACTSAPCRQVRLPGAGGPALEQIGRLVDEADAVADSLADRPPVARRRDETGARRESAAARSSGRRRPHRRTRARSAAGTRTEAFRGCRSPRRRSRTDAERRRGQARAFLRRRRRSGRSADDASSISTSRPLRTRVNVSDCAETSSISPTDPEREVDEMSAQVRDRGAPSRRSKRQSNGMSGSRNSSESQVPATAGRHRRHPPRRVA